MFFVIKNLKMVLIFFMFNTLFFDIFKKNVIHIHFSKFLKKRKRYKHTHFFKIFEKKIKK